MDTYTNEKGEQVIIATMDNFRLVNAIAKYAVIEGKDSETVKALKAEALKRLTPKAE
jgi:hypothetical protein